MGVSRAFLKKLRADAGRKIIVIADNASYHGSGPVRRYVQESQGRKWRSHTCPLILLT
jgi:hypothetical protein